MNLTPPTLSLSSDFTLECCSGQVEGRFTRRAELSCWSDYLSGGERILDGAQWKESQHHVRLRCEMVQFDTETRLS